MFSKSVALSIVALIGLSACASTDCVVDMPKGQWIQNRPALEALSTEELTSKSDAGDAEAQAYLGMRLMNGDRTEKDVDHAFQLLRQSADAGDPRGLFLLGVAYAQGSGVEKSEERAVEYYSAAAEAGYDLAQYWYAIMLSAGRGVPSADWDKTVAWLREAARQGHSDALFMLGEAHMSGRGNLEADVEQAAFCYRQSNRMQFNQKSQFNLRYLIDTGQVSWKEGDPGKPPTEIIDLQTLN